MKKILILEDEARIQNMLGDLLEKKGVYVEKASRIDEALKLFYNNTYDLLIVDLNIDNIKTAGLDFIKKTFTIRPTPFLIITGFLESFGEEFDNNILRKPFSRTKFYETIGKYSIFD